jgi:hypothetical protein
MLLAAIAAKLRGKSERPVQKEDGLALAKLERERSLTRRSYGE